MGGWKKENYDNKWVKSNGAFYCLTQFLSFVLFYSTVAKWKMRLVVEESVDDILLP